MSVAAAEGLSWDQNCSCVQAKVCTRRDKNRVWKSCKMMCGMWATYDNCLAYTIQAQQIADFSANYMTALRVVRLVDGENFLFHLCELATSMQGNSQHNQKM